MVDPALSDFAVDGKVSTGMSEAYVYVGLAVSIGPSDGVKHS